MPSLSRSSSDLISFVLLLFYNRCLPKTFEDDNNLIKFYVSVWNLKKDFLSRHYSSMTNLLNEWQIIMYCILWQVPKIVAHYIDWSNLSPAIFVKKAFDSAHRNVIISQCWIEVTGSR